MLGKKNDHQFSILQGGGQGQTTDDKKRGHYDSPTEKGLIQAVPWWRREERVFHTQEKEKGRGVAQ